MQQRKIEIELARRIQSGDEAAFDEFAQMFGARLLHYSLAICRQREDAEEVVQDTLLSLHQHLTGLRDAERVRPWAFRVAKNICLMKRRKKTLNPEQCRELQPCDNVALSARQFDLLASVQEALGSISMPLRMVFVLRAVEELSTEETAEALEISVDAVKSRMRRARKVIREKLSGAPGNIGNPTV